MTFEEFKKHYDNILNKITNTLSVKAVEYSRNNNPLHNFEKGSIITGLNQFDVLDGMLLKHYISYRDILSDLRTGKKVSIEQVNEKFGDIHIYFIIQHIQIIQYLNKQ
jgi:hypothetical protein